MNTPQFRAHIEKRRLHRGHGWYCVTREYARYGVVCDRYEQYGPFRLKRDAKIVNASAKKCYAEAMKG